MDGGQLEIEIVASSSTNHSQPDDEWLMSMTSNGGKNQQKPPLIPKVPLKFRQVIQSKDCYDPSVVSIGPYHHWNEGLKDMEGLKFDLARQFVKEGRPEEMYQKVKQEAKDARKCYMEDEATNKFDEEQFSKMMFIDGCFILQFIYYFLHKPENLMMSNHEASLVTRDLFLLENQLPFVVLESLWSFRAGGSKLDILLQNFCKHVRAKPALGRRKSFRQMILKLYGKLPKALTGNVPKGLDEQTQPTHLLEFFHAQFVHSGVSDDHPSGEKTPSYWHYPAKEFRNVGISLKPSKTSRFSDVRFEPTLLGGTLYIPQLIIGDCTKPLLLNLVAYEACSSVKSNDWVTSYVCSLGSLIDSPEDVKELRSRGLLLSTLGSDQQVADHINEMAKHVVLKPCAFTGVKKAIESHHRNIFKRWILHYKNPVSAAIVKYSFLYGVILTAITTFRSKEPSLSYAQICGQGNSTLHQ